MNTLLLVQWLLGATGALFLILLAGTVTYLVQTARRYRHYDRDTH